jgi:hypothetical protein
VELLVPVSLGPAEDGATAAEDPGVRAARGTLSRIRGCAITTGFRSTGADDEEVVGINIAHTSGKKTTRSIIGWIAMFNAAETVNLRSPPLQPFLNRATGPFWISGRIPAAAMSSWPGGGS